MLRFPKMRNPEKQDTPPAEKKVPNEKFLRADNASKELSSIIGERLKQSGLDERYLQGASIFYNPDLFPTDEIVGSLDKILEEVEKQKIEVVLYTGGINWRGGEGELHPTEMVGGDKKPLLKKTLLEISSDLSHDKVLPEEKREEEKPSAFNFFADSGKGIIITIDPIFSEERVSASSLRSDAIAKRTILNTVRNKVNQNIEVLNWSDGGFKDIQIQFAAFQAILEDLNYALSEGIISPEELNVIDIPSLLLKVQRIKGNTLSMNYTPSEKAHIKQHLREPVFFSGFEALQYFENYKDIDIIRGGAPALPEELAVPSKSDPSAPTIEKLLDSDYIRDIANYFVKKFGHNEGKAFVDAFLYDKFPKKNTDEKGNLLVIFRLLEIGRGEIKHNIPTTENMVRIAQEAILKARGNGKDVTLTESSVKVVHTQRKTYGAPNLSALINTKGALIIETRDIYDLRYPKAHHSEVKTASEGFRPIIVADKLGLITYDPDYETKERYVPVSTKIMEEHPNRVFFHVPRKLNYQRWDELKEKRENGELEPKDIKMMDQAKVLFEK